MEVAEEALSWAAEELHQPPAKAVGLPGVEMLGRVEQGLLLATAKTAILPLALAALVVVDQAGTPLTLSETAATPFSVVAGAAQGR